MAYMGRLVNCGYASSIVHYAHAIHLPGTTATYSMVPIIRSYQEMKLAAKFL
jgi:hypothetical protein